MIPINLVSLMVNPSNPVQRGRANTQRKAARWIPAISTEQWFTNYGVPFLYTAANWGTVTWYLEVYMKASSAKALARLYDNTAAAAVDNSTITVDNVLTYARQRSAALTLTDGHEYQPQFGRQDQGAGAFTGAKLIAV